MGNSPSSTISLAVSLAAATKAEEAKSSVEKLKCKILIDKYEEKGFKELTIENRQEYADCVHLVYPQSMGYEEKMLLKGCIIIVMIGFIIGGIYSRKIEEDVWGFFLWGITGAVVFPIFVIVLALMMWVVVG